MDERFGLLPKLAFGESRAILQQDLNAYRDRLAGVVSGLRELESHGEQRFAFKSCGAVFSGLEIFASARTPILGRTNTPSEPIAGLLLSGHGHYMLGGKRLEFHPGYIMYVPGDVRGFCAGICSTVNVRLETARLAEAFQAIAGQPPDLRQMARLAQMQVTPRPGGDRIMAFMSAITNTINDALDDPRPLEVLGLDQVFYRLIAVSVWPELLGVPAAEGGTLDARDRATLSKLRDYIHANLGKPLQLTSLAILGGTSTRRVREMFLRAFGMPPADYIRDARLVHAKHLLETATEKRIREICFELGFTRASSFAAQYRQRFGEPPITTRSRAEGMRAGFEFYPPFKEQP
jgi:AraC-like DNA-binding protein